MKSSVELLERTKEILAEGGWTRLNYGNEDIPTEPHCIIGALGLSANEANSGGDFWGHGQFLFTESILYQFSNTTYGMGVMNWNDDECDSVEDAVNFVDLAIKVAKK